MRFFSPKKTQKNRKSDFFGFSKKTAEERVLAQKQARLRANYGDFAAIEKIEKEKR